MLTIYSLIHASLGIVGFVANSLLIVAIIISRRNTFLKTYTLLLFNSAVTDFIASVTDGMTMIRIVVDQVSIVYIYNGPCGLISEMECFFMYSLMLHLTMHSIALIAISFWFRSITLIGLTPSKVRLQIICLIVLAPSLILHVQLLWACSPRNEIVEILTRIYPNLNTSELTLTGSVSTLGPHTSASTLYICILPIIAYTIIIMKRRTVKRKLSEITSMSKRTKSMHEALVRALTVHAFLPISLFAGIGSFQLLSLGVPRSEFLESFATMGVSFPSVANPILTFYFVAQLRRSLFCATAKNGENRTVGTSVTVKPSISPNIMPIHNQPGGSNESGGWMPRPSDSVDIPPGLEYLTLVDYIFVKQSYESWEVSLGVETRNKYVLKNAAGQQVYYAYEESDACARSCEGKDRGFILHVIDNSGREVMRIIREYNECAGCCGGSCAGSGSAYSHQVTVEAPPDNIIGTVCQCASSTMYSYEISDQDGKPVLVVDSPGFFNMAFGEAHSFSIKTNSGSEIGEIRKEWSGFLQELFTDADNFGVKFPLDLSVFVKATLIGATFLIDFVHFEESK